MHMQPPIGACYRLCRCDASLVLWWQRWPRGRACLAGLSQAPSGWKKLWIWRATVLLIPSTASRSAMPADSTARAEPK